MANALERSFRRWVDAQDVPATIAACEPKAWLGASVGAFLMVALAAFLPVTHDFTHLDAKAALLSYLPALACSVAMNLVRPSPTTLSRLNWIILIIGVGAIHFFCASLITWSATPGTAVFSSILLFTAGFHGHLHRVTLTEPFLAVATLVACIAAALIHGDAEHVATFSVVIPAAISVELLAGTFASRGAQGRAEAERLRAAVDAQILGQQEREVHRLSQRLEEVLGANHDVRNAVMSAHLAAEELAGFVESSSRAAPDVQQVVTDLRDSLTQISAISERVRQTGTQQPVPETVPVEIGPVLQAVVSQVQPHFPTLRVETTAVAPPSLQVGVRGGALSLRRVLHNIVLNGCEGDGHSGAARVSISVRPDLVAGMVSIEVADDGPGFPPKLLSGPIEGFTTSKKEGTGLGLYTTERLVRASGGSLTRENSPNGGARVVVTLPAVA